MPFRRVVNRRSNDSSLRSTGIILGRYARVIEFFLGELQLSLAIWKSLLQAKTLSRAYKIFIVFHSRVFSCGILFQTDCSLTKVTASSSF